MPFYNTFICYNSHKHTDEQFLEVIKNIRANTTIFNEDKDYDSFTIEDWLDEDWVIDAGVHIVIDENEVDPNA